MNNILVRKCYMDLLYLCACAVNSKIPDAQRIAGMDLRILYMAAKKHSLISAAGTALESAGALTPADTEIKRKWKEAKEKAIRKVLLLDNERREILKYMDQQGIWHMSLKGSVLKDFYPGYGLREMSDVDILFDCRFREQMAEYMKRRGYEVVSYGKSNHDSYTKSPVYNFELHCALFGETHDPLWQNYYHNVKGRLVPDKGEGCGFHFTDEDFYIYIIVHLYKHYMNAGTGLRGLLDIYVYIHAMEKSIDWEYTDRELEKLGTADFERTCRSLAKQLAYPGKCFQTLHTEETELLDLLSDSGTYGTNQIYVKRKMDKMFPDKAEYRFIDRSLYLWRRAFPGSEWVCRYYPALEQHKWAIPFFYIYRILRVVLFRRNRVKSEFRAVRDAGKDKKVIEKHLGNPVK